MAKTAKLLRGMALFVILITAVASSSTGTEVPTCEQKCPKYGGNECRQSGQCPTEKFCWTSTISKWCNSNCVYVWKCPKYACSNPNHPRAECWYKGPIGDPW